MRNNLIPIFKMLYKRDKTVMSHSMANVKSIDLAIIYYKENISIAILMEYARQVSNHIVYDLE